MILLYYVMNQWCETQNNEMKDPLTKVFQKLKF